MMCERRYHWKKGLRVREQRSSQSDKQEEAVHSGSDYHHDEIEETQGVVADGIRQIFNSLKFKVVSLPRFDYL
jgi:hypothetical protein